MTKAEKINAFKTNPTKSIFLKGENGVQLAPVTLVENVVGLSEALETAGNHVDITTTAATSADGVWGQPTSVVTRDENGHITALEIKNFPANPVSAAAIEAVPVAASSLGADMKVPTLTIADGKLSVVSLADIKVPDTIVMGENPGDSKVANVGYVKNAVSEAMQTLASALYYDGTVSSAAELKAKGTEGYHIGAVYVSDASFTYNGANVEPGDMLIANDKATNYDIVQANIDGAVTGKSLTVNQVVLGDGNSSVKALAAGSEGQVLTMVKNEGNFIPAWSNLPAAPTIYDLTFKLGETEYKFDPDAAAKTVEFVNTDKEVQFTLAADGKISADLAATAVTAGSYGATAAASAEGDTFKVPSFTVDSKGRLTAAGEQTVTLPTHTSYTAASNVGGAAVTFQPENTAESPVLSTSASLLKISTDAKGHVSSTGTESFSIDLSKMYMFAKVTDGTTTLAANSSASTLTFGNGIKIDGTSVTANIGDTLKIDNKQIKVDAGEGLRVASDGKLCTVLTYEEIVDDPAA